MFILTISSSSCKNWKRSSVQSYCVCIRQIESNGIEYFWGILYIRNHSWLSERRLNLVQYKVNVEFCIPIFIQKLRSACLKIIASSALVGSNMRPTFSYRQRLWSLSSSPTAAVTSASKDSLPKVMLKVHAPVGTWAWLISSSTWA